MNPHNIDAKTPARDLQLISISVRVLERPDAEFLPHLYLTQQKNYADRILPNISKNINTNIFLYFYLISL